MSKAINVGRVTAYADAVAGGYTGTREEWEAAMAGVGTEATQALAAKTAAEAAASDSEAYSSGTRGGEPVESDDPAYHNNASYYKDEAQSIANMYPTDKTLSVSDKAADGKKVGDELSDLKSAIYDDDTLIPTSGYYCKPDGTISTNGSWKTLKVKLADVLYDGKIHGTGTLNYYGTGYPSIVYQTADGTVVDTVFMSQKVNDIYAETIPQGAVYANFNSAGNLTVNTRSIIGRINDTDLCVSATDDDIKDINNILYTTKNIWDGTILSEIFVSESATKLKYDPVLSYSAKTAKVKIKPNTAYTVVRSNSSFFGILTSSENLTKDYIVANTPVSPANAAAVYSVNSASPAYKQFTSNANAAYLYVCYTITGEDSTVAVYEGSVTDFIDDTVSFTSKINLNYAFPEDYGAVGDGITDDTSAIQKMFDDTTNETLVFNNHYLITSTITSNRPRNMIRNNPSGYIHAAISNPLFRFEKPDGFSGSYQHNYIRNLKIKNSGNGHLLMFVDWIDHLSKMIIDNCELDGKTTEMGSGYGIYCENSLAHSYITNCKFGGNGIYLNCRDANLIQKCSFWGAGNGIVINPASYGCLNNAIKDCTIVNNVGNAIQIIDGEQIVIENNQIEYARKYQTVEGQTVDITPPQTASVRGLVVLVANATNRRCEHVIIKDNNFGGFTADDGISQQINLDGAYDTVIESNRFVKLSSGNNISADNNCKRTFIRGTNYRTTQSINDFIIDDIVIAADSEIIGHQVLISNSGVVTMALTKNEEGYVSIRYFNLLSAREGVGNIIDLPTWYANPSYQSVIELIDPNRDTKIACVNTAGRFTITVESGSTLATGLYYPKSQYYCGFGA